MPSYNDDNFALQRLYEKWVVKDEWLLNDEAVNGVDFKREQFSGLDLA